MTNNKDQKSGRRQDQNCDRWGNPESMEHLLPKCGHYSTWGRIEEALTQFLDCLLEDNIPNEVFRTMWSRYRDVVLEGRTIDLGKPRGVGKFEWGGGGQFTSNLGPGWTRIAPRKKEGFQVSKRDSGKGELLRDWQGEWQGEFTRGCPTT